MDILVLEFYNITMMYFAKGKIKMYETRIKKIFDILTQDMTFHTSGEISSILDCSSRTIRDEIKSLNVILSEHGASVVTTAGKGCIFEVYDKDRFEAFIKTDWHKYAFEKESFNNPQFRLEYILRLLLFNNDYVKVDDICEELLISRSQFNKDIKIVKMHLSKYNLEVESKPYAGIIVEGSELNKRLAIANCLYENMFKDESYLDIKNSENEKILNDIKEVVINTFLNYEYETSETAFKNLIIHLYIAIRRIQSGDEMNVEKGELIRLKSKNEYIIACEITTRLSEMFEINFPEEEIAYISIHLLGKKISKDANARSIPSEVENITIEMLNIVKNEVGIDLTGDLDLRISLGLHITPLIDRIQYGLVLNNPVLEDIKKDVFAFDAAAKSVGVLNKKYGVKVSEDEIGYIALHLSVAISRINEEKNKKDILIICGSGVGTANMMKYRFLREFEQHVNSLETCDYISANEADLDQYDLIITSVPLSKETKTPIIEVGLFLNKEDIINIRPHISSLAAENKMDRFFSEELFFYKIKANSYKKLLEDLSIEINRKRCIKGNLYGSIMDREKLSSTAFDNSVAMPHPINPMTEETFITIAILDKPVKWNDKKISLVILLNIKEGENSREIEEFYYKLGEFMSDEEKISKALKSKNINQFLEIFNE